MNNDKQLMDFLSSNLPKCRLSVGAGGEVIVFTGMCVEGPSEDGKTTPLRHMTDNDFLKIQIEFLQSQIAQMQAFFDATNGGDRDGYKEPTVKPDREDNVIVGPWPGSGVPQDEEPVN